MNGINLTDCTAPALIPCTDQQLIGVFRWFKSQRSVLYWAGPGVVYPLQVKRFKQQSKYAEYHSFVFNQARQLLAFGQISERFGYCHLSRIVVAPAHRGRGVGNQLIAALLDEGQSKLSLSRASLLVLKDNKSAIKLYEKIGFSAVEYPQKMPVENCLYMTRE